MSKGTPVMNDARFRALADAYGADIDRWPVLERSAARSYAAENPHVAGEALREASLLDGALDAFPSPEPSAALRDRILAGAPRGGASVVALRPRRRVSSWFDGGLLTARAAALLIAALVGSVAAGFVGGQATNAREAQVAFLEFAFSDADTVFNIEG